MEPVIPAAIASSLGVASLAIAGGHFGRRRAFVRNSAAAGGVIVGVTEERDGQEVHASRYPKVRFRTASGRDVTFESQMGIGGNAWRIGATVPVRYPLDRPAAAEIDSFATLWGATLLFALLGFIFLTVGVSVWLRLIPVS